jgi:hypothetical protein
VPVGVGFRFLRFFTPAFCFWVPFLLALSAIGGKFLQAWLASVTRAEGAASIASRDVLDEHHVTGVPTAKRELLRLSIVSVRPKGGFELVVGSRPQAREFRPPRRRCRIQSRPVAVAPSLLALPPRFSFSGSWAWGSVFGWRFLRVEALQLGMSPP